MTEKKKDTIQSLLYGALSFALLFLLWMLVSSRHSDFLPTPQMCIERYQKLLTIKISNISLAGHIFSSVRRVLIAFSIAGVVGVSLGLIMGWSDVANAIISPIFEIFRPIPPIAWIPIVILWFGVGETSKIFLVLIGCIIPIVLNTYTGVRLVDPILLDVGRMYKGNTRQLISLIVLPASLPTIFAGLKTAISAGWMIVLAAEMIASRSGIGFLINRGMEGYDIPLIFISMLMIGIIGFAISLVLSFVERLLCPWMNEKN